MEATEQRKAIRDIYATYPDVTLRHVVKYNRLSIIGAPRNSIVIEKELVADVAQELLDERNNAS